MKQVITVSLPRAMVWKLTRLSHKTGIPRSRLIETSILFEQLPALHEFQGNTPPSRQDFDDILEKWEKEYQEAHNG